MNDTAIIIVNYKCFADTKECIDSLKNMDSNNYHIFIVENGSNDESSRLLSEEYINDKNVTLLLSTVNLGFAGGNNLAIREAYNIGYHYFWLLNADTLVHRDCLEKLRNKIANDESVGIVGSKIYYYNSNLLWFAGGIINVLTGAVRHVGIKERDDGKYDESKETGYITGCSLLFRREMLDSVGLMNEDYFLYFEETDWNIRAKQKGWKIWIEPESVLYHKVSASSGGESNVSPYVAYYEIRNSFMMISRTQPFINRITAVGHMLWTACRKSMKIVIKRQDRRRERYWYIFKGVFDALNERMGIHPSFDRRGLK